jgi:hypothetical protein
MGAGELVNATSTSAVKDRASSRMHLYTEGEESAHHTLSLSRPAPAA